MLNKDYYKEIYDFIDQGIIIFDKKSKSIEYSNNQLLAYLNTKIETIDFEYCNAIVGILLKKFEKNINHESKIIFTALDDNMSKELLRKGPMIIFTWMNKENWPTTYVSANIEEVFGYSVEEFIEGDLLYSDIIFYKDLEKVGKEVKEAIDENKYFFYHEPYRITCKNGETIWVSDFTVLIKNHNGE